MDIYYYICTFEDFIRNESLRRIKFRKFEYELLKLYWKIEYVYPTKCRAMYEIYIFWSNFRDDLDEFENGFGFEEFRKLRKFESLMYQYVNEHY